MSERFAVLFDLDGTLVDSIGLLVKSMQYAYEGRVHRPNVAEWVQLIGTPLDDMLGRWAENAEDVDVLKARYREHQIAKHDEMTTAYPGTVETIRALHAAGHALAVVTSKLELGARRSLKFIGVEDCFATVVGIDHTAKHKPDPAPVRYALEVLDVSPSRAVFIGDSTHDMRAGRAASVPTAAALWGPYTRAELEPTKPDYWLGGMDEVLPLVERLTARV